MTHSYPTSYIAYATHRITTDRGGGGNGMLHYFLFLPDNLLLYLDVFMVLKSNMEN